MKPKNKNIPSSQSTRKAKSTNTANAKVKNRKITVGSKRIGAFLKSLNDAEWNYDKSEKKANML